MQKHRKKFAKKLNRVMAYIYVPLLFSFLAYGVTYLIASDVIGMTKNLVSLVSSDAAPEFSVQNESVFKQNSAELSENNGVITVKRADVGMAEYGQMYAYVRCTRIALDAPVYMGDDDAILKKGIGQNFATFQPGFGGLILLGGHNNTYFNALKNISIGDNVEVETSYGTYVYQVSDAKILNENDSSAYDFGIDHEQLVLYTCYPFDMLAHTPKRFFVYCDLVSGPVFVD